MTDRLAEIQAALLHYNRHGAFPTGEMADDWLRWLVTELTQARAENARLRTECDVLRPGAENYNRERLRAEKAESSPAPTCSTCRHRIDRSRAGYPDWCVFLETSCDHARIPDGALDRDAAWLASEARKGLT